MNLRSTPTASERRHEARMPLQIFLNEYVDDRPQRCMSLNLSPSGLYLNRLNLAPLQPSLRYPERDKLVGLEFELPQTGEVIWAAGRVRFGARDPYFHGTGVTFDSMANLHRRLVRDYVLEFREQQLRNLLAHVRRNRRVLPTRAWLA